MNWVYILLAAFSAWNIYSQYDDIIEDKNEIPYENVSEERTLSERDEVENIDAQEEEAFEREDEKAQEKREEKQAQKEREEEKEREETKEKENQRQEALNREAEEISEKIFNELTEMMAGDPYNEDRYIDVNVNRSNEVVNVVVDESTFSSLDLDLKARTYEAIARDIQQIYKELRDYEPDSIIVKLLDSNRDELASYQKDILNKSDTLEMNHNNDNNF